VSDPRHAPARPEATYGPPSSLRRWLAVTRTAVAGEETGERASARLEGLTRRLARQWRPANQLPSHLVHGDLRLGNAVLSGAGQTAYLDFGFAALRPRIHELAYTLFWVILRPDSSGTGAEFDWSRVPQLVEAYEEGLRDRLTPTERAALGPYLAAVPLYFRAIAGFTADPAGHLDRELPSIRIAEWVLDHPVLP
jgi:Ser/Thr protein kinase RdoA (MazF antagonist)